MGKQTGKQKMRKQLNDTTNTNKISLVNVFLCTTYVINAWQLPV